MIYKLPKWVWMNPTYYLLNLSTFVPLSSLQNSPSRWMLHVQHMQGFFDVFDSCPGCSSVAPHQVFIGQQLSSNPCSKRCGPLISHPCSHWTHFSRSRDFLSIGPFMSISLLIVIQYFRKSVVYSEKTHTRVTYKYHMPFNKDSLEVELYFSKKIESRAEVVPCTNRSFKTLATISGTYGT